MKELPKELSDEMTVETTPDMRVLHFDTGVPIYSTPALIRHMEGLCVRMLLPFLDPGEASVGYRVDVKHLAPTRIGMRVTVKARLREADGRRCLFEVEAYNETGAKIGEGIHERRVINLAQFRDRVS